MPWELKVDVPSVLDQLLVECGWLKERAKYTDGCTGAWVDEQGTTRGCECFVQRSVARSLSAMLKTGCGCDLAIIPESERPKLVTEGIAPVPPQSVPPSG